MATITYFLPDEKKSGGTYVTVAGAVKKIDAYERKVVLTDIVLHPAGILLGCGFAYAQPDEKFREFFVTGVEYAEQFPCRNP